MAWTTTSATQHEAFKTCERYWYFGWIERLPTPKSPAMLFGSEVHGEVEHFLKMGGIRRHRLANYVVALKPHLPPPRHPELVVEHQIRMPLGNKLSWLGFLDNGISLPDQTKIQDLKVTGNFRYAKTPDELRENVQMISYAKATYELGHKGPLVLEHLYAKSEKHYFDPAVVVEKLPPVKPVSTIVTADHVEEIWQKEMRVVERMRVVALAPSAKDVAPTGAPRACYRFNSDCPFLEKCGLSKADVAGFFKTEKQKLTESQKMAESFAERMRRLKAEKEVGETKKAAPAKGILAKDAPSREVETTEETEESTVSAVEAEAPKKRGRPKKNAEPAKTYGDYADELPKSNGHSRKSFALFIDCMPQKRGDDPEPTLFEDWFAPIVFELNEHVKEEKKLEHYLQLPYGEAKTLIALALQEKAKDLPPAMYLNSNALGAQDACGFLIPHATSVTRRT